MTTPVSFHLFARLSNELQQLLWKYTIQPSGVIVRVLYNKARLEKNWPFLDHDQDQTFRYVQNPVIIESTRESLRGVSVGLHVHRASRLYILSICNFEPKDMCAYIGENDILMLPKSKICMLRGREEENMDEKWPPTYRDQRDAEREGSFENMPGEGSKLKIESQRQDPVRMNCLSNMRFPNGRCVNQVDKLSGLCAIASNKIPARMRQISIDIAVIHQMMKYYCFDQFLAKFEYLETFSIVGPEKCETETACMAVVRAFELKRLLKLNFKCMREWNIPLIEVEGFGSNLWKD